VAGPKVVESYPHATFSQPLQMPCGHIEVGEDDTLGDLEFQQLGRQARSLEADFHRLGKTE
jgi:hypothetical protein